MSGAIRERMTHILNDTGFYRLTGSSSADWELGACAAGLEQLDSAIEALLADLFPATASLEQLERWESLFQPQPGAEEQAVRQEIGRERLAVNPTCFTPGSLRSLLRAAGVIGAVTEGETGLTVAVGRRLGLSAEECRRELDLLLPAHLGWIWDETVHWEALDAWSAPFEALDARGLTWAELDAMTREQLESEPEAEDPDEESDEEEEEEEN